MAFAEPVRTLAGREAARQLAVDRDVEGSTTVDDPDLRRDVPRPLVDAPSTAVCCGRRSGPGVTTFPAPSISMTEARRATATAASGHGGHLPVKDEQVPVLEGPCGPAVTDRRVLHETPFRARGAAPQTADGSGRTSNRAGPRPRTRRCRRPFRAARARPRLAPEEALRPSLRDLQPSGRRRSTTATAAAAPGRQPQRPSPRSRTPRGRRVARRPTPPPDCPFGRHGGGERPRPGMRSGSRGGRRRCFQVPVSEPRFGFTS